MLSLLKKTATMCLILASLSISSQAAYIQCPNSDPNGLSMTECLENDVRVSCKSAAIIWNLCNAKDDCDHKSGIYAQNACRVMCAIGPVKDGTACILPTL